MRWRDRLTTLAALSLGIVLAIAGIIVVVRYFFTTSSPLALEEPFFPEHTYVVHTIRCRQLLGSDVLHDLGGQLLLPIPLESRRGYLSWDDAFFTRYGIRPQRVERLTIAKGRSSTGIEEVEYLRALRPISVASLRENFGDKLEVKQVEEHTLYQLPAGRFCCLVQPKLALYGSNEETLLTILRRKEPVALSTNLKQQLDQTSRHASLVSVIAEEELENYIKPRPVVDPRGMFGQGFQQLQEKLLAKGLVPAGGEELRETLYHNSLHALVFFPKQGMKDIIGLQQEITWDFDADMKVRLLFPDEQKAQQACNQLRAQTKHLLQTSQQARAVHEIWRTLELDTKGSEVEIRLRYNPATFRDLAHRYGEVTGQRLFHLDNFVRALVLSEAFGAIGHDKNPIIHDVDGAMRLGVDLPRIGVAPERVRECFPGLIIEEEAVPRVPFPGNSPR